MDGVHRVVPLKDSDNVLIQPLLQKVLDIRFVDLDQLHDHPHDVEQETAMAVLDRDRPDERLCALTYPLPQGFLSLRQIARLLILHSLVSECLIVTFTYV